MEDCLFCKIVKGDIPSYTIYEDDIVRVFMDINPMSNGHLLIVPKNHIKDANDIDDKTFMYLNSIIKKIYIIQKEKLNFDGLRIVQNNECCQDIKHYHIHMVPVYKKEQQKLTVEEIYNILKKED